MPKKTTKKVAGKTATPAKKEKEVKKTKRQEEVTDDQDNLVPKALVDEEGEADKDGAVAEVDPEAIEGALIEEDFAPDMDEETAVDEW